MHLASFRGAPVLLNLWATWCEPCREETPYLETLQKAFGEKGLEVIGLSEDTPGSEAAIAEFTQRFGVTYTVLHDPGMLAMDRYGIIGLPTTLLMDRGGIIRYVIIGAASTKDPNLVPTIRALLQ